MRFGEFIMNLGAFGAGLYGFFNRLLIPFGLHHALNSVFWFDVAGINDIGKFWGTMEGGILGQTGMYMSGFFPVMMFGLPAAALAMYHTAKDNKKKIAAGLLFSAAIASFFNGVTEPLEFSFMFLAPALRHYRSGRPARPGISGAAPRLPHVFLRRRQDLQKYPRPLNQY